LDTKFKDEIVEGWIADSAREKLRVVGVENSRYGRHQGYHVGMRQ
jgi:hypothetical protein